MGSIRQKDSVPGKLLKGEFLVQHILGSGAVCDVYKAAQQVLRDRPVAVRMLKKGICKGLLAEDLIHKKHFLLEADLLAKLKSPCFVRLLDAGTYRDDDIERPYVVIEYVEGTNLEELVAKQGPQPLPDALAIALQVGEGLAELARVPLVYRDLNPSNAVLEPGGAFGSNAKLFDLTHVLPPKSEPGGTAEKLLIGVAPFAPPEQSEGISTPDSDVYSLAAVLHYLLEGKTHLTLSGLTWKAYTEAAEGRHGPVALKLGGTAGKRLSKLLGEALEAKEQARPDLLPFLNSLAEIGLELKGGAEKGFLARFLRFLK